MTKCFSRALNRTVCLNFSLTTILELFTDQSELRVFPYNFFKSRTFYLHRLIARTPYFWPHHEQLHYVYYRDQVEAVTDAPVSSAIGLQMAVKK